MKLNFTPKYSVGTIFWQVDSFRRKVTGFKIAKISISFNENFEVDENKVFYLDKNGNHLCLDNVYVNRDDAKAELEKYTLGLLDDDIASYNSNIKCCLERIHEHKQSLADNLKAIGDFQKKIRKAEKRKRELSKNRISKQ